MKDKNEEDTLSRFEKKQEKTRQEIIDTAENLFFDKGFDNTTSDDIANNVYLSKATVYKFFKSKEEILSYVIIKNLKIIHNSIIRNINNDKTAYEQLRDIVNEILGRSGEEDKLKKVNNFISYFYSFINNEKCQEYLKNIEKESINLFEIVDKIFLKGKKDGSLKIDGDVHKNALEVIMLIQSLISFYSQGRKNLIDKNYSFTFQEIIFGCIEKVLQMIKK